MEKVSKVIVDTSVLIAVLVNEPIKKELITLTKNTELIAPSSVHWEIGNAFSAMLKRKRVEIATAIKAIQHYNAITIEFVDIELEETLLVADKLKIYAYDAYLIVCALKKHCPLISLDNALIKAANSVGVKTLEIAQ